MDQQPSITISSLDLARIEKLMHSAAAKNSPGLAALQNELDRANVLEPTQIPPGLVTMNSTVRFIEDASGALSELTLVYPDEGGAAGSVSILAPVGSALLGLSVGQSIHWQVPGGRELELRILDVVKQPEAMGKFHR
ncbi:nucleoside diphosphate kinase regulator [Deefgea piscis]|uniref:Nucleoside diphosphate kinase regulator n=1 Tax=Deefgea piscis TaxID=2739061 RepID=A0A6M8SNV9_9NEIS|nr:nucleoside diphosphate kinase regulator [Deefgea piscis]QKJ66903.1 nucleoside diphosphate kinase regulator [Deefgea piscis]